MVNKRGAEFALEELIQLVIAIIAIIIMITIITKVSSCKDTSELQARGLLDKIIQNTSRMNVDETSYILLNAPNGWKIVSFDTTHNQNTKDESLKKPGEYFGMNVLCICRGEECAICAPTSLPFKEGEELVNIKIETSYLIFSKTNDKVNISKQQDLSSLNPQPAK